MHGLWRMVSFSQYIVFRVHSCCRHELGLHSFLLSGNSWPCGCTPFSLFIQQYTDIWRILTFGRLYITVVYIGMPVYVTCAFSNPSTYLKIELLGPSLPLVHAVEESPGCFLWWPNHFTSQHQHMRSSTSPLLGLHLTPLLSPMTWCLIMLLISPSN